jgi:hypothetical protein
MKTALDAIRVPRLLLIMGAVAAVLAAGCSVSTGGSSSPSSSAPQGSSAPAGGRSFNLPASVHTLMVNNRVGTLRVTATHGSSQIHVVEQPTGKSTASHHVAGSTATISASCPDSPTDCHMAYQVTMPSTVVLNVDGAVGEVTLRGGLNKAHIKTDAGKVSGSGLGRGSYTVATQAGQVDLTFASAPSLVKVNTDAGSINVTVPGNASYRVNASSDIGSGDVSLPNHANAANKIDLHADIGQVSLHKG